MTKGASRLRSRAISFTKVEPSYKVEDTRSSFDPLSLFVLFVRGEAGLIAQVGFMVNDLYFKRVKEGEVVFIF